jgi:hypothetical protein
MKPEVRVFSKTNPCSKLDLWLCFKATRGFSDIQVDQAHALIGKNAPRVMERKGYLRVVRGSATDSYQLTAEGQKWLLLGIRCYAKNHPTEVLGLSLEDENPARGARIRRVR